MDFFFWISHFLVHEVWVGVIYHEHFKKNNMFCVVLLMAEILHQLMNSFSHYFLKVSAPCQRWLFGISAINVVQLGGHLRVFISG